MRKTAKQLVDEANEQVEVLAADEALSLNAKSKVRFVDIRDVRELAREGRMTDAIHAPRGMLEFWFDPESPYHKAEFAEDDAKYVLFCAAGWRSALAAKALVDMGFDNIAHVDGGFAALRDAGARVEKPEQG